MSRYALFDRSRIELKALAQRGHDLTIDAVLPLEPVTRPFHHPEFGQLVKEIVAARRRGAPVIVMILEGDNVIERVRDLLGPTDSSAAPAGTIRGDMGTDMMRNVVHASDSPESAEAEIRRFFAPEEIYD